MASKTGDILHTQAKAILGLIVSKLSGEHPQAPYSSLHSAAASRPQTMELAPWSIHFPSASTGFSSRKPLPGVRSPIVGLSDRTFKALAPSYLAKARKVAHHSSAADHTLYTVPFSISNMHGEKRSWRTICDPIKWHRRSRPAANRGASAAGTESRNAAVNHRQHCNAVVCRPFETPRY